MRLVRADAMFRANPDYEVVVLDRLEPAEQARLRASDDSEDLYGALIPRHGSALEPQAVSSETALLVFTLATAGPAPGYVVERLGDDAEQTIRRLVFDSVLEVFHEGRFLCGPCVSELLNIPSSTEHAGERNLAVAALRYGQGLERLPQSELALRLYAYGRQPISPKLAHRFVVTGAVASFLGIDADGPVLRALGTRWVRVPRQAGAREHWWEWIAPSTAGERLVTESAGYKLYLSPAMDELPAALTVLADILVTSRGVTGFKVGAGLPGICRPDKTVVYFTHFDDLRAFAAAMQERLAGCAAHGVPFTAVVTFDGLLSWAADPPRISGPPGPTSWRMWVTERLAEHLVAGRSAGLTTLEPWQYALERLRLGGVDTRRWVPSGGMWPEALAAG